MRISRALHIWILGCALIMLGKPLPLSHQGYRDMMELEVIFAAPVNSIHLTPWELITAFAWSPSGEILAIAASNHIYLYQVDGLKRIADIQLMALSKALVFSSDGSILAVGSNDGYVRLWDLDQMGDSAAEWSPRLTWSAHKKGVNSLVFSPDGTILASAGNDAVARLWDWSQGSEISALIGGTYSIPSLVILPDAVTQETTQIDPGKTETLLALVNGDIIRLRVVANERIWGTLRASGWLYSQALSPSGDLLAAGDVDNKIYIWNPSEAYRSGVEQYPEPKIFSGHNGKSGTFQALIWSLAFHPDGTLLASGGGDGQICIWDVYQETLIGCAVGHGASVTSLAFNPNGDLLASAGLDGVLNLWQVLR